MNKDKKHIQRALGISPDEYFRAVEQGGYEWIDRYFGLSADMSHILATCTNFWKWWVNQWDIRDADFVRVTGIDLLDEPLEGRYWEAAFENYLERHNALTLSVRINRLVIEEVNKRILEDLFEKFGNLKKHYK